MFDFKGKLDRSGLCRAKVAWVHRRGIVSNKVKEARVNDERDTRRLYRKNSQG
jgi:hypothetical protein